MFRCNYVRQKKTLVWQKKEREGGGVILFTKYNNKNIQNQVFEKEIFTGHQKYLGCRNIFPQNQKIT